MPRVADPSNELGRSRTEEWREKLRAEKAPESCHVDTALAAAVAVLVAERHENGEALSPELQALLSTTLAILKKRGFHGRRATTKLQMRLLARADLETLQRAVSDAPAGASL